MNQILTDEELIRMSDGYQTADEDPKDFVEIARALEKAIINKLNSAEPVAWMQISVEEGVSTKFPRDHLPKKFNADWWRFEPLYEHPPAPSAVEGLRIIDRGFIYEDGVHTPTLLIGFNTDDFDSRDKLGEMLSAARSDE